MDHYQINSDRFINIGGEKFPLTADVFVQNNDNYTVKIPIPEAYPDTPLKMKMAAIDYNPSYSNFLFISMHRKGDTLDIIYFTVAVNFPELQEIALPVELEPMKGLGRVILCKILQRIIYDVQRITLEASPLAIIRTEFRSRVQATPRDILLERCKRNPITRRKMIEFMRTSLRVKYEPEDESFEAILLNSVSATAFLIDIMTSLETLESLVKYYKTYGFVPESQIEHEYDNLLISQNMSAPYKTVVENCLGKRELS